MATIRPKAPWMCAKCRNKNHDGIGTRYVVKHPKCAKRNLYIPCDRCDGTGVEPGQVKPK